MNLSYHVDDIIKHQHFAHYEHLVYTMNILFMMERINNLEHHVSVHPLGGSGSPGEVTTSQCIKRSRRSSKDDNNISEDLIEAEDDKVVVLVMKVINLRLPLKTVILIL